MSEFSFQVYGGEFTRTLAAVALFQAAPRDIESYAAVRCLVRHDGLTMLAQNGTAGAAGNIATIEQQGTGLFSIPHAQVKALLAIFKRRLPKDMSALEYVLEVTVTDRELRVHDISELFDGDEYVIVLPDPRDLQAGEQSEVEKIMATASSAWAALRDPRPLDLTDGVFFPSEEISRIARAAKAAGIEVHVRAIGRYLVAPLSEDLIAWVWAEPHSTEHRRRPFIDDRSMSTFLERFEDIVDRAVI